MFEQLYHYLQTQMQTNQFFSAAFVGTIITGSFIYFKSIPLWVWNKIVRHTSYKVTIYQYDELFDLLEQWMNANHPKTYRDVEAILLDVEYDQNYKPLYNNTTISSNNKTNNNSNKPSILLKQESVNLWIKYQNRYINIGKNKEKLDRAENLKNVYFAKIELWGLFAEKQINNILQEALLLKIYPKDEIIIKTFDSSYGEYRKCYDVKPKPFENIIINKETKEGLIDDIDNFINSKVWYDNRFIKFKRGYCFHGKPGNGKTSLSMAIAHKLNWNYYSINISSIDSDYHMLNAFRQLSERTILAIEDIDTSFNGREVINSEKNKLSFATILNCLDGLSMPDNIIIIITTNHVEKLDPALIRSGRIDKIIEIPNPKKLEVEEYLNLFFDSDITLTDYNKDYCMADIQNICLENKENLKKVVNLLENLI
jgi:chaperone BCS1